MNVKKQPLKAASTALFEFNPQNMVGPSTTHPTTTTITSFTTATGFAGMQPNTIKRNSGRNL